MPTQYYAFPTLVYSTIRIVYREIFRTAITSRIVYRYSIIIKRTLLISLKKKTIYRYNGLILMRYVGSYILE